jgi:hypothetical protein
MMPHLVLARELRIWLDRMSRTMRFGSFRRRARDIHVMAGRIAVFAAICVPAAGCMHEQLAWPPTSEDIRRINETSGARNGGMRVQYVEPLATYQGAHVHAPTAVAAVDLDGIVFRNRDGETHRIPIATVRSVTVIERGTGALIGGAIGFAGGAALLAIIYLVAAPYEQSRQGSGFGCEKDCATGFASLLVTPMLVGAVVGYLFGARLIYEFGDAR